VAAFPPSPISPADFLEGYLAERFSELDLPEAVKRLDLTLGVRLDGDGGGEWLFALRDGALEVAAGSREEAAFTVTQSVEDWRGALWEGRGGVVAGRLLELFRRGAPSALRAPGPAPDLAALERLSALDGLVRGVVTGGPAGDWSIAFKLGPGEIPEAATATISIHHDDAAAVARRELGLLDAFMAGRISVEGDLQFFMQVQATLLGAAEAARGGP
jgi:hypothetical protein